MRYTYAYKDSEGKRHEESMDAASREAVFEVLRARGIRPIKVVAADGSKANKGILTGWSDVFPDEGERFFASFAIPGVKAGQRNTTVEELNAVLGRTVAASPDDGMEARQIKSMVEGMKAEARAYIAAGGTIVEYGKRLTERQDAEIAIYERTKADLEQAKETMSGNTLINYWESQNDKLRNLGIRPLTLESLE